jgi:hypothetical protein
MWQTFQTCCATAASGPVRTPATRGQQEAAAVHPRDGGRRVPKAPAAPLLRREVPMTGATAVEEALRSMSVVDATRD